MLAHAMNKILSCSEGIMPIVKVYKGHSGNYAYILPNIIPINMQLAPGFPINNIRRTQITNT